MKRLLPLLLFISNICHGQNYQCLQSGVRHYFINGNNYLKGIRIDSVRTIGGNTVYYPFHTPRGSYDTTGMTPYSLNDSGGSWLGKKVVQMSDGTFIFDSYWKDSVIIKTKANIGDSWTFYNDTTPLYYRAQVIGMDTMTVLGVLDSIKKILITARNPSGIVTTDPVDSFQVFLSKNNGFVQVFDLYTFPYHKPDSAYRAGLDYYLDISSGRHIPAPNVTIFNLVDFINPNQQQLYNWNIGDVIESYDGDGNIIYGPYIYTRLLDTVANKVVSGHLVNYTISGSAFFCPPFYPCSLICKAGSYSFSDLIYPIIDTSVMTEETSYNGNIIHYYPFDTNYCIIGPAYTTEFPPSIRGLGWSMENAAYKLGIGKTYFYHADGEPTYEMDGLLYYNINGTRCGTPLDTNLSVTNVLTPTNDITIFPNPAQTTLTIELISKSTYQQINTITITNLLGQTVYTQLPTVNCQLLTANIAYLPTGVYIIKINGTEVRKFVKE